MAEDFSYNDLAFKVCVQYRLEAQITEMANTMWSKTSSLLRNSKVSLYDGPLSDGFDC